MNATITPSTIRPDAANSAYDGFGRKITSTEAFRRRAASVGPSLRVQAATKNSANERRNDDAVELLEYQAVERCLGEEAAERDDRESSGLRVVPTIDEHEQRGA